MTQLVLPELCGRKGCPGAEEATSNENGDITRQDNPYREKFQITDQDERAGIDNIFMIVS